MNQEKFVNYYIELLTNTINESIQKNLVFQTEKKVSEHTLKELSENFKKREMELENSLISQREEVENLRNQLNEIKKQKEIFVIQTDELLKNKDHIETFKNELLKERKENERLNEELEKVKEELSFYEKKNQKLSSAKVINSPKKMEHNIKTVEDAGNF